MALEDLPQAAKVGLLGAIVAVFAIGAYGIISWLY